MKYSKDPLSDGKQTFRAPDISCSPLFNILARIEYYRGKNSTERKRDVDVPLDSLQAKGRKAAAARGGEETERESRNYPYIPFYKTPIDRARRRFSRDSIQTKGNLQILARSPLKFRLREFETQRRRDS